jgi:hypothetical protein
MRLLRIVFTISTVSAIAGPVFFSACTPSTSSGEDGGSGGRSSSGSASSSSGGLGGSGGSSGGAGSSGSSGSSSSGSQSCFIETGGANGPLTACGGEEICGSNSWIANCLLPTWSPLFPTSNPAFCVADGGAGPSVLCSGGPGCCFWQNGACPTGAEQHNFICTNGVACIPQSECLGIGSCSVDGGAAGNGFDCECGQYAQAPGVAVSGAACQVLDGGSCLGVCGAPPLGSGASEAGGSGSSGGSSGSSGGCASETLSQACGASSPTITCSGVGPTDGAAGSGCSCTASCGASTFTATCTVAYNAIAMGLAAETFCTTPCGQGPSGAGNGDCSYACDSLSAAQAFTMHQCGP